MTIAHRSALALALTACVGATLAGRGGGVVRSWTAAGELRQVAVQGLRPASLNTLRPAAISEDGHVIAFVSAPPTASGRRCCQNVFALNRATGLMTQESVGHGGAPPNGDSQSPSLSLDGRLIAFETIASNLDAGSSRPAQRRVVLRNRETGTLHAPRLPTGEEPDGESGQPVVSGNGVMVAFASDATNLVAGSDANGRQTDIYAWRIGDATLARVSVTSDAVQPAAGASHSPSVNRDADLIAFVSSARLASEDTNNVSDVYLRDLRRGGTSLVSRAIAPKTLDGASHSGVVSADGGHVAFVSETGNLSPADRNGWSDVYVFDVAFRTITLVSATSDGKAGNAASSRPAISADGRYVVYQSLASNLGSGRGCPRVASDRNLLPDVYLFDRATSCVSRVSGSAQQEWWTPSVAPAIDGPGAAVVFSSTQPADEDDESVDFDLFLFVRRGLTEQRGPPSHGWSSSASHRRWPASSPARTGSGRRRPRRTTRAVSSSHRL